MSKLNSSKNMNSSKYKEKQKIKIRLVGSTNYHSLIQNDTINQQNIFRLVNNEFKFSIKTILMDLNFLLFLTEENFFQELQNSEQLRICLQSCLVCLPKKQYCKLSTSQAKQTNQEEINLYFYQGLLKVVLTIYHRIVSTKIQRFKHLIYDLWLFDIPKLIDFCLIYVCKKQDNTYSNLQIVRNIVDKAIKSNYNDYKADIQYFINFLYQEKMETVYQTLQIIVDLQNLSNARKTFKDPLRSFLISANKTLFQVKDLFITISYFYLCFPTEFVFKLATDHEIQQKLIKIFIKFSKNVKLWKVSKLKHNFQINFASIKEKMANCMRQTLEINSQILKSATNTKNQQFTNALTTYNYYAIYFSCKQVFSEDFDKFINSYISQVYPQRLFFIQKLPNISKVKFSQKEIFAIQKSIKLQDKIRQKRQSSTNQSNFSSQIISEKQQQKDQFQLFLENQRKQLNKIIYVPQAKQILSLKKRKTLTYFDDFDDTSYNIKFQIPNYWCQFKIKQDQDIKEFSRKKRFIEKQSKESHFSDDSKLQLSFDNKDNQKKQKLLNSFYSNQDSLSFQGQSENNFSNISSIKQNLSEIQKSITSEKSLLQAFGNNNSLEKQKSFKKTQKIHFDHEKLELSNSNIRQLNHNEKQQKQQKQEDIDNSQQNLSFQYEESQQLSSF